MFKKFIALLMIGAMICVSVPIVLAQEGGGASPRWKAPRQVFSDMETLTSDASVRITEDTHEMWLFNAAAGTWTLVGGGAGLNWIAPVIDVWDASGGLPVGPVIGDRYMCSVAGTGWTLNHVYQWSGAAWVDYTPITNDAVYNGTTTISSIYDGTTWRAFGMTGAWLGLTDTPKSYVGQNYKLNKVNVGETGLEYTIMEENGTGDLTVGNGLIGHDYTVTIDGPTNNLIMTWLDASATFKIDSQVDVNLHKIINLQDPTAATDAANKYYVDTVTHGLLWLEPIISFYDPTPGLPGAPVVGDRYTATATANGWTADHIYECVTGGTWIGATDTTPANGNAFYNNDDSKAYLWYVPTGGTGSWVEFGSIMTHNALGGLQGGLVGPGVNEYYHMSSTEYHNLRDNMAFADTGVIYSDAGKLQVDNAFIWNKTTHLLTIGEDVVAPTVNVPGYIKMISAGNNAFYSTFITGTQTADATYTLPTAMPAADKYALVSTTTGTMSWTGGGGIAAPGSDKYVIFNDAGVFGADVGYQYDKTTNILTIGTPGTPGISGTLKIYADRLVGTDYYTMITGSGSQTEDVTYTMPIAKATANGQMLASTTAGIMSWTSPTLQYVTDFGATTTNSTEFRNASAIVLGKDETALTPNIAGSIKLWSEGDNAFYNTFTSGTNTANATYTLPTAMPTVAGQVLGSTLAGVMSWGSGGSIPAPGSDKYIIFNDGGVFGSDKTVQYDKSTYTLTIGFDETTPTVNKKGTLKMISAGDNAWSTTISTASQAADVTFTLPSGLPSINNVAILSSTSGGLSFNNQAVLTTSSPIFASVTGYGVGGVIAGTDEDALTPNVAGMIKLWSAGDNAFYSTFTAGTQTANATYTLPVAMPAANNLALISSTAGVMSWNNQALLTTSDPTFNSVTVSSFLALTGITAEPLTLVDGMVWYRSDLQEFHVRTNGTTYKLAMTPV